MFFLMDNKVIPRTAWAMLAVKNLNLMKQQTPKPEAQFPDTVPPFSVHCSSVLQTPLIEESITVVHSTLRKVTTENKEKASEIL